MTSKHSPGPWRMTPNEAFVQSSDGSIVAMPTRDAPDNRAANQRLIASAPDLLDACQHALNFAHALRDSGRLLAFREPVNGHYTLDALLYAAIRKATGEDTP